MAVVLPPDVLFHVGPRALRRYGTMVRRRWEKEVNSHVFTRAAPALIALGADGIYHDFAVDQPRFHYPPGLVGTDGNPLEGLLFEATRQNKLDNGDFEQDANGAVANGSTVVRDGTQFKHGAFALKVTTTNATSSGTFVRLRSGARPAVTNTSSRLHTWQVWVYAPAGSVGKTVKIRLEWWTSVPAFISANETTGIVLVAGWQLLKITAAAPGTATLADVFIGGDNAQGIWDFWIDLAHFDEGAYAVTPIPTNTAVATSASERMDVPIIVDLSIDWTLFLWFLPHHGNVTSWPDTEPQTDPFLIGFYPDSAGTDNTDSLRIHRQNAGAQYEWEYGANTPTAARTFTTSTNAQKLTLRHYASDHHLDAAIDGGAFIASGVPATMPTKPFRLLRLGRNPAFVADAGNWVLFDCLGARGLRSQAEMEAY